MTNFVDIESPYSGGTEEEIKRNLLYARACVRDSLMRGEIPFASHLFYTQPGILDDNLPEERMRGIEAGKKLIEGLQGVVTVVYQDLGISKGMNYGIDSARNRGRTVEFRTLGSGWESKELNLAKNHSHSSLWGFSEK